MNPDEQISFLQNNCLHLWIEYGLYPGVVFWVISRIVHKSGRDSHYIDVPYLLEIVARNWLELAITFGLSLFLFEARLSMEYIPLLTEPDGVSTINPIRFAAISNYLATLIIFSIWFIWSNGQKKKYGELKYHQAVFNVRMSFIPIVVVIQLWISTILYYDIVIRLGLTALATIVIGWLVNEWCYTPSYWRSIALAKKAQTSNIILQLESLEAFIKAYKCYGFPRQADLKYMSALDCGSHWIEISNMPNITGTNNVRVVHLYKRTLAILEYCKSVAQETSNYNSEPLGDCISELNERKTELDFD